VWVDERAVGVLRVVVARRHRAARGDGELVDAAHAEVHGTPGGVPPGDLDVAEAGEIRGHDVRSPADGVDRPADERQRDGEGEGLDGSVDGVQPVRPLRELVRVARLVVRAGVDAQVLGVELKPKLPGDGRRIGCGEERIAASAYGAGSRRRRDQQEGGECDG
jgi:hypothetical protein